MKVKKNNFTDIEVSKALKIYNYFIENSFSNFEEKKLSKTSFRLLLKKIKTNKLPFILAIKDNKVIGLAFVNKFREKSGYRFSYEHSIYVDPDFINNGYGNKILKELVKICKKITKIKNLIAVIGGKNNFASIKIHKNNGFQYIGTIKKAGFKKNKWIDSIYMQKRL
ncbi:GNAT family N-acetyltransferase [Pelagibacteraceae bacterium]|nr:GNAT family N-acetyltransferase [Pelagibacteraceae bacterium]MDC3156337.1 GNAT family N-acetyltransferase [Pelagibacteraceae bacterium]